MRWYSGFFYIEGRFAPLQKRLWFAVMAIGRNAALEIRRAWIAPAQGDDIALAVNQFVTHTITNKMLFFCTAFAG